MVFLLLIPHISRNDSSFFKLFSYFFIIIKSDEQRSPSMYLQDYIQSTFRGFRCSCCRFIWAGMHPACLNIRSCNGMVFHSHPEFRLAQDFWLTVLINNKKTFTSNKLASDHPRTHLHFTPANTPNLTPAFPPPPPKPTNHTVRIIGFMGVHCPEIKPTTTKKKNTRQIFNYFEIQLYSP